uniref:Uncharacterized protein n=1 Tax=Wuchereria bancrofti TaxID=6293 RepID=A0A1I8E9A8_WUCBA
MRRNGEICVDRSYSENSREKRSEILIERRELSRFPYKEVDLELSRTIEEKLEIETVEEKICIKILHSDSVFRDTVKREHE